MYLINKLFKNDTIRTIWNKEQEKYFISVIDITCAIFDSKDGGKYWNKLKQRLKEEGNETVTNCHQLKLVEVVLDEIDEIRSLLTLDGGEFTKTKCPEKPDSSLLEEATIKKYLTVQKC